MPSGLLAAPRKNWHTGCWAVDGERFEFAEGVQPKSALGHMLPMLIKICVGWERLSGWGNVPRRDAEGCFQVGRSWQGGRNRLRKFPKRGVGNCAQRPTSGYPTKGDNFGGICAGTDRSGIWGNALGEG